MIDMFFLKFQSDHISSLIKCFRDSLRTIKLSPRTECTLSREAMTSPKAGSIRSSHLIACHFSEELFCLGHEVLCVF